MCVRDAVPEVIAQLDLLRVSVDALRRESVVKTGGFSQASSSTVLEFTTQLQVHQRGCIPLPASLESFGSVTADPFCWLSSTEPHASPRLRQLLQQWACAGATPSVDVCFVNTETLTRAPLVAQHETARYTGVPNLVTLWKGLGEDTVTTWTDATTSWDWKRQTIFTAPRTRKKVAAQAVLQVTAFSSLSRDGKTSIPVFFSDMATGVRCWIMVDGDIYTFHKDGGADLTLEQGIRLFRYFIATNGSLLPADKPPTSPPGASEGEASERAPFTPGPKPGSRGGRGGEGGDSGGKGGKRDAHQGHSAHKGEGEQDVSSVLLSPYSSPGAPSWTREDAAAAFQMELAVATTALQRCGVDLTGVVDPST